jgi:UDP-N-acetyl-D-galactosamine dehydrogenase
MGLTFKEDVADIRNTKVVELVNELMGYSINVHVADPWASPNETAHEYHLTLTEKVSDDYDAIVVSVAHQEYRVLNGAYFKSISKGEPILFDLKGIYNPADFSEGCYWRM